MATLHINCGAIFHNLYESHMFWSHIRIITEYHTDYPTYIYESLMITDSPLYANHVINPGLAVNTNTLLLWYAWYWPTPKEYSLDEVLSVHNRPRIYYRRAYYVKCTVWYICFIILYMYHDTELNVWFINHATTTSTETSSTLFYRSKSTSTVDFGRSYSLDHPYSWSIVCPCSKCSCLPIPSNKLTFKDS